MTKLDIAQLLLLAALWGGSFLLIRIAVPVIGPIWLIELRVLVASLALLPLLLRAGLWPAVRQNWRSLLIVGGLNSALPYSLLAFSAMSFSAGFSSILNATTPLFGSLAAAIWLGERSSPVQRLGLLVGFIGVVILVGWQSIALTSEFVMATAAGLLAALLYAVSAPYIKQKLAGVPSLAITTGSLLGATLLLLPVLPFTRPQQFPTLPIVLAVLVLALLSTALAYIVYFRLLHAIGPTKTLTVAYLIPLFAMVAGALVLQEAITSSMLWGCGLILLGTAIANDLLTVMRGESTKTP
jgi:drug/metabolite transporter (DMT)-like permease